MKLVDWQIKEELKNGNILIKPFIEKNLGACTYDLTLGNYALFPKKSKIYHIDATKNSIKYTEAKLPITLASMEFVLLCSKEIVGVFNNISALICGRSSISRLGLGVEQAPFIDTGFVGNLTLEIFNFSPYPIILKPKIRIAQLWFERHEKPSVSYEKRRNSKYLQQSEGKPRGFSIDTEWRKKNG